jgi:hypothetical protein
MFEVCDPTHNNHPDWKPCGFETKEWLSLLMESNADGGMFSEKLNSAQSKGTLSTK